MSEDVKQMVSEVFIALAILVLVVLIVLGFSYGGFFAWPTEKIQILFGVFISAGCCMFMMLHMAFSYSRVVEMVDEKSAKTHMARSVVLRYLVVLMVAFLCYLTKQVNMLAFAFGILLLKPALYMRMLVHRVLCGPEPEIPQQMPPEDALDEEEERIPGVSHHLGDPIEMTKTAFNGENEVKDT